MFSSYSKLVLFSGFLFVGASGNPIFGDKKNLKCPKGWLNVENTCYIRQTAFLNFDEAVRNCESQEAKIFDFDDSFEFEAVRNLFPDYYFTWIRAEVEEELEWLYEPYEEKINGKNVVATCIAFFSSPAKSYNFYYPCSSRFYSICEKSLDSFHQWMD